MFPLDAAKTGKSRHQRCKTEHAERRSRRLSVTTSERGGSISEVWSVDLKISIIRRGNRAGTGTSSLTVHGASFGGSVYCSKVKSGFTGCEATGWESETSMKCLVGSNVASTRRLALTLGEQSKSLTHGWSMDAAVLSQASQTNGPSTQPASFSCTECTEGRSWQECLAASW